MSSLNDHVVFITGGTYGVGRGIARAPVYDGAQVFVWSKPFWEQPIWRWDA